MGDGGIIITSRVHNSYQPTNDNQTNPNKAYNAIWLDQDKCIKCGRCVAVCEKVQGIGRCAYFLSDSVYMYNMYISIVPAHLSVLPPSTNPPQKAPSASSGAGTRSGFPPSRGGRST